MTTSQTTTLKPVKRCNKAPLIRYSDYPYYNCNGYPEREARNRRVHLFVDITGLRPLNDRLTKAKPLAFLYELNFSDHCSSWEGPTGTLFVLLEPYCGPSACDLAALKRKGIVILEVPIDLAPYGGLWDVSPGALPGSRSYLLTRESNAEELEEIANKLREAEKTCPPWNSLDGGDHV